MHTPPDKCPKCGAPLDYNGVTLYCGSWFDASGKLQEGTACKLAQRAQKAEGKLKQVETFCQKRAGHRLMQVAQPFRELLNILK